MLRYITRHGAMVEEHNGVAVELKSKQERLPLPLPLLRPLSEAKRCVLNLGENPKDNPNCGSCTTWNCDIHGKVQLSKCVNCGDWQTGEAVKERRQTIRLGSDLFPDLSVHLYNSSIVEYQDGYLFAFRSNWGNANVSVVRMDQSFRPIGNPVRLKLHVPGLTELGREDPRLFWYRGRLHVWYIGWNGDRDKWATSVLYARINEKELKVEEVFCPDIPARQHWEKNHAYFESQGHLYCVYQVSPHRILQVWRDKIIGQWQSPMPVNWRFGAMRGGASPVLHNGEFYHFFHGMIEANKKRLYSIGCAVFEAAPPFRILRFTNEPIDVATLSPGSHHDVLFPGGAVVVENKWWAIAMGVNDTHSEIRFYDLEKVEAQLVTF